MTTSNILTQRAAVRLHVASAVSKWVLAPLATIFVSSFVIFMALTAAPGDPISQVLGDRATDEQRQAMREALGLDQPAIVRYFDWLAGAFSGNFGLSFTYRQPVEEILAPRIGTTAFLVCYAAIIILIIGIGLGSFGGQSRRFRPAVSAGIAVGIAIPSFVAAIFLSSVFAVSLGWFPTYGAGSGFLDMLWHMTLPAIALAIGWSAYVAQITTAAIREVTGTEQVVTARARSLPRGLTFRRHIFRNASLPVLTASGLTVAGLVAGSAIVESAFAIDGIGSLLVRSVAAKDYPVVMAISLIIVVVFVVVTTAIDIAQNLLDPRRRGGGAR